MKFLENRGLRPAASLLALLLLAGAAGAETGPSDGVEPILRAAAALEKGGRQAEAVRLYRKARRLDPSSAEAALRLGVLLGRMGYLQEGRRQLQAAAAAGPDRPEVYLELGKIRERMLDHEGAAAAFGRVLELEPEDRLRFAARVGLGKVLERTGRLDEAILAYRTVLDENPRSPAALAHLGLAQRMRGDFDGAMESWRSYLKLRSGRGYVEAWLRQAEESRAALAEARRRLKENRGDPAPWNRIGELLLDAGDLDGAVEALERAVAAGAAPGSRLLRAEVLQERGRWKEADADLKRYLEDRPGDRSALYRLALGRRRLEDCRGEQEAWRRLDETRSNPLAFRLLLRSFDCGESGGGERLAAEAERLERRLREGDADPGTPMRLGLVREAQGRPLEALDQLRASLQKDPHDSYLLQELRRLATDHPEEALDYARELEGRIRAHPENIPDLLIYAYLVWLGGDTGTAMRLFQASEQIDPDHPAVQIARAHAGSILEGDRAGALRRLRRAAAAHPDSATTLLALGLMELEGRRIREAVEVGEKLLAIDPDSYHALGLLGSAHAAAGRHEAAVGYLLGALRADPTDPEGTIRFQLALSLAAAGKIPEARWVLRSDLPWPPVEIYRRAWQLVREYFVDRSYGGQDWLEWRDRFDGGLRTRGEAYRAVVEMLAALEDRWTRLRRPEETDLLFLSRRSDEIELDADGKPLPTSRTVVSEDLAEGIRYLRLTNLSDPGLLEEVRRSLESAGDSRGVILDLRGNPGGTQGESEAVGSMFLEEGTPMGEQVDRYGRRPIQAGGEEPIDPDLPLVVLVDENTGSAAEALAGALREAGRAKVIGAPTRGKGASQISQILPGGAMVLVTAARNVTPTGAEIEGSGIQPDVRVDREADGRGEEAWIETAREVLEEEKEEKEERAEE